MGVAGGEKTIWAGKRRIILNREKELRQRPVETLGEKMREPDEIGGGSDTGARTEA